MELKSIVEAILFATQHPLAPREIKACLNKAEEIEGSETSEQIRAYQKTSETEIHAAIEQLNQEYTAQNRSFHIQQVAGTYQLVTQPLFAPWLTSFLDEPKSGRLSMPALETLAIIAYRQPITRADIEAVRGVAVDGVMQTLLERGLVSITGRAEVPGRPMLYGTTRLFLEQFALSDLNQLPALEELRHTYLKSSAPQDTPSHSNAQEMSNDPPTTVTQEN